MLIKSEKTVRVKVLCGEDYPKWHAMTKDLRQPLLVNGHTEIELELVIDYDRVVELSDLGKNFLEIRDVIFNIFYKRACHAIRSSAIFDISEKRDFFLFTGHITSADESSGGDCWEEEEIQEDFPTMTAGIA